VRLTKTQGNWGKRIVALTTENGSDLVTKLKVCTRAPIANSAKLLNTPTSPNAALAYLEPDLDRSANGAVTFPSLINL